MAFVLTLLYVAISLLSPAVLPTAIMAMHVNIILGVVTILAILPQVGQSRLGDLPDAYLLPGLLAAAVISMVTWGLSQLVPVILEYVPIFIVVYFLAVSCKSLFQIKVAVYVLFLVAIFIFAQGAIADHSYDLTSHYLMEEGIGPNAIVRYKGLGVLSDPNDLAQFFATLIPLLWLRWKRGKYLTNFLFTIVPASVLVVGMYYTHSRGGAIALVALILFGFKDKLGFVLSSVLAGLMLAGLVALGVSGGRGMNDDDGGRVAAWVTGLELFKSHPIFGIGIGKFGEFNETGYTAHNSYVLCLAEIGITGYFCWLGMIVTDLTELGAMVRSGDTNKKEKEAGASSRVAMPPYLSPQPAIAGVQGAAFAPVPASAAFSGPAPKPFQMRGVSPVQMRFASPAGASAWQPPSLRLGEIARSVDPNSDENLAYAAKVMRVSFVGLLTSAYFLSRTFSMVFYIALGLAAALRIIYRKRHPEVTTDVRLLVKRIMMFIVGSVVFLYLFVRIRGLH